MFWIARVPELSVSVNPGAGTEQFKFENVEVEDYHDLPNVLRDGASVPATVSWKVRWSNPTTRTRYRNADQRFTGLFMNTRATVEWRAKKERFEFISDAADTSATVHAQVGKEHNGLFF